MLSPDSYREPNTPILFTISDFLFIRNLSETAGKNTINYFADTETTAPNKLVLCHAIDQPGKQL